MEKCGYYSTVGYSMIHQSRGIIHTGGLVAITHTPGFLCEEGTWKRRVREHKWCLCLETHKDTSISRRQSCRRLVKLVRFYLFDHTKRESFGVRFYFNRNECIYTHRGKDVQNYEVLNMIRDHFHHLKDGDLV